MPLPVDAMKIQFIQDLDITKPPRINLWIDKKLIKHPHQALMYLQQVQTELLELIGQQETIKAARRDAVGFARANGMTV